MTLRPGTTIADRYVIDGVLARGGMAEAYRATDRVTGRSVAVEVLVPAATDARRFTIETRLLATLTHPNLVRLLDAGLDGPVPYLVTEHVDGDTLANRLVDGPLAPAVAARVGADIAGALAYVHARGVVHRGITPSNIVVTDDGRSLLSDVGVVRLSEASPITATGAPIGSPAYLAPEQVSGTEVGSPADVYTLGLVLIEALTGRPAFDGTPDEILAAKSSGDPKVTAQLPDPWPMLLLAMTGRDPAIRPEAATVRAYLRPSRLLSAAIAAPPLDDTSAAPVAEVDDDTGELEATQLSLPPGRGEPAGRRQPVQEARPVSDGRAVRPVLLLTAVLAVFLVAGLALAFGSGGEERGDAGPAPPLSTTSTSHARAATTTTGRATTSTTAGTIAPPTTTAPRPTTAPSTTIATPAAPAGGSPTDACALLDARAQELEAAWRDVNVTYRHDRATRDRLRADIEAEQLAIDTQRQDLGC